MSYPTLSAEQDARSRAVSIRSILLGTLLCIFLGWAIPFFDIIKQSNELGGSHFPVGPIFLFTVIILLINIPVKALGWAGNIVSGLLLGFGGAFAWFHYAPPERGPWWLFAISVGMVAAVLLTALLMGIMRSKSLSARELLVIFSMMLIASGIPTFGLVNQLFPVITSWLHHSKFNQNWSSFFQYLPDWMVVGDPKHILEMGKDWPQFDQVEGTHYLAIQWFYDGVPERAGTAWKFMRSEAWRAAWWKPLLAWSGFVVCLYTFMFSITSILRKQWIERERLQFPLMQLPVEMARGEDEKTTISSLLKNRFLLAGFAIPFVLHGIVQLRFLLAGTPSSAMTISPFSGTSMAAWGRIRILWWFSVIGFSFLLSTEISLSVWLFFVINRLQHVVCDWMGYPTLMNQWDSHTAGAAQFNGALLVFVLFGLYAARGHLRQVFRKAVLGDKNVDDSAELIGYRASCICLLVSLAGLVTWCVLMGMAWWFALFVFFFFTITIIGITRAVTECGLLFVKFESGQPRDYVRTLLGTKNVPGASLTVLGFIQYVSMYDLKTLLMPALMHGCKARDAVGDRSKKTLWAFVIAIVVVVLVSSVVTMHACYQNGAQNVHGWFYQAGAKQMAYDPIAGWINEKTARGPDSTAIGFMVGGALVSGFLIFMRRALPWWPLHPIGYIFSQGYFESTRVVFTFFLGWLAKFLVLKFGGGRWFKRLRPCFLGLILGEFGAAGFWIFVRFVLNNFQGPSVFP